MSQTESQKKRSKFKRSQSRREPIPATVVWCPCCDWHQTDSWSSRRRMGEHVADEHYDEVVFPAGEIPDDLEDDERQLDGKN